MPRDLHEILTIVVFIFINCVRLDELNRERRVRLKLRLPYTQVPVCSTNTGIEYALGFLY